MRFSRQEYWSGAPLPSPKNTINDIKNTLEGSNSKLSEKEFRIMIVKMITNLENKMERM